MMRRVRWFLAEWPVSLRTIATKMRANAFAADSLDGFIIDRVRDNLVNGRYIEKISFQQTITDPFGDTQVFDRVEYRQLEFNLFSNFPNIELWDAPRSTNAYATKLQQFANFALSIEGLSVNLIDWVDTFQSKLGASLTIDSLQISGLEIDKGVNARIVLSGEKDVREALRHVAKNKKFELEKLHFKLMWDSRIVTIHLGNSGSVRIDEEYTEEFIPYLRSALPHPRKQ